MERNSLKTVSSRAVGLQVCSATGHCCLGRWEAGSLTALIPCMFWAIGKCRGTALGAGELSQSETWESQSWLGFPCNEAWAVGSSGACTSRCCWELLPSGGRVQSTQISLHENSLWSQVLLMSPALLFDSSLISEIVKIILLFFGDLKVPK